MILIEKRSLFTTLLLSLLLVLGTAVWAYRIGMYTGLKGDSELVLFLGFMGTGLQLFLYAGLFAAAKKKQKDFSLLMESIKSTGMLSEQKAKKLGSAGLELQEALTTAHRITMRKTLKIASLHGLIKMLMEMIDVPIFIVDLAGKVIEASPKAQTETSYKHGCALTDVFPALNIKEAFKEASNTRLPVEQSDKIIFIPVFSTTGEISFFIVDLSKQGIFSKLLDKFKYSVKDEPEKNKFWDPLKNFLRF